MVIQYIYFAHFFFLFALHAKVALQSRYWSLCSVDSIQWLLCIVIIEIRICVCSVLRWMNFANFVSPRNGFLIKFRNLLKSNNDSIRFMLINYVFYLSNSTLFNSNILNKFLQSHVSMQFNVMAVVLDINFRIEGIFVSMSWMWYSIDIWTPI